MPVGHYENFPVASLLLPARMRTPVAAIYRFARAADDFADEGDDPPQARLAKLQHFRLELEGMSSGKSAGNALFADLGRIVREHRLPLELFRDLLDAFSQDVVKLRYADFAELLDYCRRSANPIGRLLLILFGKNTPENEKHSDCICTALQIINFWQDIAIDYAKGRIYLPQDEMRKFGVSEQHIAAQTCDAAWIEMMQFQTERARKLMLSGSPLGRALPGRIGLEIRATMQGGLRILEKLERAGYDMFRRRPVLKRHDWAILFWRAL